MGCSVFLKTQGVDPTKHPVKAELVPIHPCCIWRVSHLELMHCPASSAVNVLTFLPGFRNG